MAVSADGIDLEIFHQLKTACTDLLCGADYLHQDKRTELRQRILAEVEAVKAQRNGNVQDELYRRFLEAGKRAVAILKGEV
jgi:hypothetical protein